MADVPVQFSASSGSIITTQPVTATDGAATAVLSTLNDPSNRDITVTARVGAVERTLTVPVSGTSLTIQGPDALVSGVQGNYTVILNNSAGAPVPAAAVTLTAPSATLSSANLITDSNGRATFNMSQTAGGTVALQSARTSLVPGLRAVFTYASHTMTSAMLPGYPAGTVLAFAPFRAASNSRSVRSSRLAPMRAATSRGSRTAGPAAPADRVHRLVQGGRPAPRHR